MLCTNFEGTGCIWNMLSVLIKIRLIIMFKTVMFIYGLSLSFINLVGGVC